MTKLKLDGRTIYYSCFQDLAAAHRWADHADIPMAVVMGDCPEYWVVRLSDARRLVREGYELAR